MEVFHGVLRAPPAAGKVLSGESVKYFCQHPDWYLIYFSNGRDCINLPRPIISVNVGLWMNYVRSL